MSRSREGMWTVSCSIQIRTVAQPLNVDSINSEKKKNAKGTIKIPSDATINVQLDVLVRCMRVLYFRDIFIFNVLPTNGSCRNESGIVNLMTMRQGQILSLRYLAYAKKKSHTLTVSVIFDRLRNWCNISGTVLR